MELTHAMMRTAMEVGHHYHSNQYSADSACEHCAGVIRHTKWCITRNKRVRYAYEIILHPEKMTPYDNLALKGMSVSWCAGLDCKQSHGRKVINE